MRKTSFQLTALVMSSLALLANADFEREFSVDAFDSVAVSQGINLNLVMGSASVGTAVAEDKSDLDRVEIEVGAGVLEIRQGSLVSGLFSMNESRGNVMVKVIASELQAVAWSSGANADLIYITCTDLHADASSGSRIEVIGSCNTVAIDAFSGANVDSSDLIKTEASVESSSGATIRVFASESFRGDASSGSSIRVYRSPEATESEMSSGASIDLRSHTEMI